MTHRRLFWLAFAACLCLAVFWGVRLLTTQHRINRESFEKIQVGMTQSDVESLLGVPPGDYSTREYTFLEPPWPLSKIWEFQWIGNDGRIRVKLDEKRNVATYHWCPHLIKETLLDK